MEREEDGAASEPFFGAAIDDEDEACFDKGENVSEISSAGLSASQTGISESASSTAGSGNINQVREIDRSFVPITARVTDDDAQQHFFSDSDVEILSHVGEDFDFWNRVVGAGALQTKSGKQ